MRILIADDSIEITRRLQRLLLDMPHVKSVLVASSIAATIAALHALRPDLLILDHHFPEGHGIEILDTLPTDERSTRVVLFSSYASTLATDAYSRHHMDAILDKSRDLEALLEYVASLSDEILPPVDGTQQEIAQ